MIVTLGHVSGAHINPAVTVAFWSARRFPAGDVLPYMAAQCVGATAAAVVLRAILGDEIQGRGDTPRRARCRVTTATTMSAAPTTVAVTNPFMR